MDSIKVDKTHICILLPDLRGGGAERVSLDLASKFLKEGYEIEFVLMRAVGDLLDEAENKFNIFDLKIERSRSIPIVLSKYLEKTQPDVLIVSMWPLTVCAAIAKLISKSCCKLILLEHSVLSLQYYSRGYFHGFLLRLSMIIGYRLANHIVAVSDGVASDLANLSLLHSDRITVIYNPIPHKEERSIVENNDVEKIWSDDGHDALRILAVGSFKVAKNYPLLLHAFSRVAGVRAAKLLLLGDGELRPQLEKLVIELGISDDVIMPGFVKDPTPFYQSADLFVLSSNREGLPTVLIEAMAAGVPVISTNCRAGPAEILNDGKFGTLVPVDDVDALAKAIEEDAKKAPDVDKLQVRAKDFSPEIAFRKYLELIQR